MKNNKKRDLEFFKNMGIWFIKSIAVLFGMKLVTIIYENFHTTFETQIILAIVQGGLCVVFAIITINFARKQYISYLKNKKKEKGEQ